MVGERSRFIAREQGVNIASGVISEHVIKPNHVKCCWRREVMGLWLKAEASILGNGSSGGYQSSSIVESAFAGLVNCGGSW